LGARRCSRSARWWGTVMDECRYCETWCGPCNPYTPAVIGKTEADLRARIAALEAQVAALSAEPTEDDVDDAARLIAYEMADTMGDTKAVFWSGYTFKDAARTASRAALTAFLRRRSQP